MTQKLSYVYDLIIMIDWFMVFNAVFKNISVLSWQLVLLVEETGENHQPAVSHLQIDHILLHSLSGIRTHNVSGDRY